MHKRDVRDVTLTVQQAGLARLEDGREEKGERSGEKEATSLAQIASVPSSVGSR
jgi:hypothetical protein